MPLAFSSPWIAAVGALLTNSSVGLVEHGLPQSAPVLRFMTRLYGRFFSRSLGSVSGDRATLALYFPARISWYRVKYFS